MQIKAERWCDSDFVITIDDIPVGYPMPVRDAMIVVEWFKTAAPEIEKVINNASE